MILCDVGNSTVDILENSKRTKIGVVEFDPLSLSGDIYYVSVNRVIDELLKTLDNWHNVGEYVEWSKYYPGMGIDRVMVCEAIKDGVVVDAGSAITVDLVRSGNYEGGFISLGLRSAREAYKNLSPALDMSFNFEVDLTIMAKNTADALTIGYIAPLVEKIKSLGEPLYVTGGDAYLLSRYLVKAQIKEDLIFEGMKKLIDKGSKC